MNIFINLEEKFFEKPTKYVTQQSNHLKHNVFIDPLYYGMRVSCKLDSFDLLGSYPSFNYSDSNALPYKQRKVNW